MTVGFFLFSNMIFHTKFANFPFKFGFSMFPESNFQDLIVFSYSFPYFHGLFCNKNFGYLLLPWDINFNKVVQSIWKPFWYCNASKSFKFAQLFLLWYGKHRYYRYCLQDSSSYFCFQISYGWIIYSFGGYYLHALTILSGVLIRNSLLLSTSGKDHQ